VARGRPRLGVISPRERDVIRCAGEGMTRREMGSVLGVSDYAINNYIESAFSKLDARNMVHAYAIAQRRELL